MIKIWNLDNLDTPTVLEGHTHNVRGMAFCPEFPWMLVSGSWDGTIRIWDTRNAKCMTVVKDHQADVYGISFHHEKPFSFLSCSRDTTIRLWQMETIIQSLKLNLMIHP
jgi:WD40 repeat protein